jgi:hypothetical protein
VIYIWCSRFSEGAKALAAEINTQNYWAKYRRGEIRGLEGGDMIVNWGEKYPFNTPPGVLILNQNQITNKMVELGRFKSAQVPCVEFSSRYQAGFIPRSAHHTCGNDLIQPPRFPAYYVRKYEFAREFRVHVVKSGEEYVSIRSGIKTPIEGQTPHPWIRSHAAGWYLNYGAVCQSAITNKVRNAAKEAVKSLGLDFAAIDVGVLANGNPIVLEANRAPGNEGNTTKKYAGIFIQLANKYQNSLEDR